MSKRENLFRSFKYAFDGVSGAIKSEPNFRIHIIIAVVATAVALVLGFNPYEMLILEFSIFFVLILELVNTSLEAIVDLVSPRIRTKAKIAKDVSAAAVLMSSLLAFLVGIVLFLPRILEILNVYGVF